MIVFEMNMKNPLTKRFVKKIPMDKTATMLDIKYSRGILREAFGKGSSAGYTYFFPWRNKIFTWIEHRLAWVPLGGHYYVLAKKY